MTMTLSISASKTIFVVLPGLLPGLVDDLHHALVEGLVHEGGLPAARDTGDDREEADRELRGDVLEVVLLAALDRDVLFRGPALSRDVDLLCPREVLAGQGLFVLLDLLRVPFRDNGAAVQPGAGAHVDHVLCGPDHVLVVLDHEHRVPEVAEGPEGLDQFPVVALVEPDGGLVEDVEDAHQVRADLGGEPDPLGFPARERPGVPGEREVPEADLLQEVEPGPDLLDDLVRDLRSPSRSVSGSGTGLRSPRPAGR